MSNVLAIIPARYESSRFPGKPLAKILGKTLIQRTFENISSHPLISKTVIATDHPAIFAHAQEIGAPVVMTSSECQTGTERLTEVLNRYSEYQKAQLVLNVQGDEPCVEAKVIEKVVQALIEAPEAVMSTPISKIDDLKTIKETAIVKCVTDINGFALYFSRSPIPGAKTEQALLQNTFYRHIGIYCYRTEFLLKYPSLPVTPLQQAEDLEQLKVLEYGYRIKTALVKSESLGVDHPEDIKKVEHYLCKQNTYS